MWIILAILALLFLVVGALKIKDKNAKIFSFLSLSFTILTQSYLYTMEKERLLSNDIGSMLDVMPTMSKIIWIGSIISIILNGIIIIKENKKAA